MRPKIDPEKKKDSITVAMRLTDAEHKQAQALAENDHRTLANFARLMFLRGLNAWMAENPAALHESAAA